MHLSTSPSTRAQARGGQAISDSRQENSERHAQPVGYLFAPYVGLHGPGWLYVLGMPPRGYLPFFATLKPQSKCHVPRPGPALAAFVRAGSCVPRCRENEERPTGAGEKRGNANSNTCVHSNTRGSSPRWADARLSSAHARNYLGGCRQIEAVNATQHCQGAPSKIHRV